MLGGDIDNVVRSRGIVMPVTKPPHLESQFPSKPLPGPSNSGGRMAVPAPNKKINQPARPQSATPEITLYHRPGSSSATRSAQQGGVEEQKRERAATASGSKRPVSAPQHQQNPALNPASILHSLLNKTSVANQEALQNQIHRQQNVAKNNYFLPATTAGPSGIASGGSGPQNNKDMVAHSRNLVEQVYHTPVINFKSSNQFQGQQSRSKSASHSRPSSQSQLTAPALSAVDRALSIGKSSQLILQERDQILKASAGGARYRRDAQGNVIIDNDVRSHLLNDMLEGNIIEKLDTVLLAGGRR